MRTSRWLHGHGAFRFRRRDPTAAGGLGLLGKDGFAGGAACHLALVRTLKDVVPGLEAIALRPVLGGIQELQELVEQRLKASRCLNGYTGLAGQVVDRRGLGNDFKVICRRHVFLAATGSNLFQFRPCRTQHSVFLRSEDLVVEVVDGFVVAGATQFVRRPTRKGDTDQVQSGVIQASGSNLLIGHGVGNTPVTTETGNFLRAQLDAGFKVDAYPRPSNTLKFSA